MNSPAKEQQEEKSEDLSEILSKTFDRMDSKEEVGDDEEVAFSEEDGEEAYEADEGEEEGQVASTELKEDIQDASDSDYKEPAPERWADEIKAVYNSLPPAARKAMLDGIYKPMQRSYTQATQDLATMRSQINPVLEAMNQYGSEFERTGVSPQEAFKNAIAWSAHLQRVGAEQGLKDMQEAYGVGAQKTGQQGEQYLTPTERFLKQQIDALKSQVTGQQTQSQQRDHQQQIERQKGEIEQTLENFVNEKTEDGNPRHPHVHKVARGIAGVIRGGLIDKADEYGNPVPMRDQIAKAYTMACYLDPSIRAPSVNARQAHRVKAAQRASVVTRQPAGKLDSEEMDMAAFIEKTYDQLDSGS